jgi:subtilisin-like proprotein convertase family protein
MAQTYTNPAPITINDNNVATPYPSTIAVANPNVVLDVNVAINGFTHTWCNDVEIVLVGPTGVACMLIADAGGSGDPNGNYIVDQAAAAEFPPTALPAGTYRPTNVGAGDPLLPAPFPVPVVTVPAWNASPPSLNVFNNTLANGTWSLYVRDQVAADVGAISGGWGVTMVTGVSCTSPLPTFCTANVATGGSSATQVDVNDLLAVISTWGSVGPPRPQGDCAPLPNGDCSVDVNDLLAVISSWGSCFPPTGRCCLGVCTEGMTQADCVAAGGLWGGADTTCVAFNCPILNDEPAGAFVLNGGIFPTTICNAGTNAGATTSVAVPNPSCSFGGVTVTRDVWWKYTVPTTPGLFGQTLRLDTCSNVAPFTDTVVAAYTGTAVPLALTPVACNDDAPCGPSGLNSRVATPMIPAGQTVYVRVGSWGTGAANQGNYSLCVSIESVTQDVCLGAETIAIGGSDTDDLLNASQDLVLSCQGVGAGRGKWYKFQGNGNAVQVSTCTSTSDIYDGQISVYCAGVFGCSALNCVASSNDGEGQAQLPACPAFQGERVQFCTNATSTYYVLVAVTPIGLPGGIEGEYTLTVTQFAVGCPVQTPPLPNLTAADCNVGSPPANDDCAGAIVASVGNTTVNNAIATPALAGAGTMCGQPWSKDIWYMYTSTNGGVVTITLASNPVWDSIIEVYSGSSCAPLGTVLGCVDDAPTCVGCHGTVTTAALAPNTTMLIRIASWNTSGGALATMTITDP